MEALADVYTIPQEHLDFRDTIRQIAQERVAPRAAEIDEKAEYPRDIRQLFAEHDLFGLPFDTEYGGTGTGALMLNMAIEEISKVCASSALMLMVQELGTLPIRLFGTEEQRQRFVELYLKALDDAGMPTDPEFRDAVREHVEFGTQVAKQNSNAETDDQLHPLREVPRWTWAGDD